MVEPTQSGVEVDAVVAAARAGDESAFGALVERYRRELQVHCYRMLGSFEDSEDLVQERFLRAWRKRKSFQGRSTFRAWLYGIATNACLDALRDNPRRALARQVAPVPPAEIPWLQPYPDRLLEGVAANDAAPDAAVVAKETIELAVLQRYMEAHERADATALAELLREDARFTMPPQPMWCEGREAIMAAFTPEIFGPEAMGDFRLVPTRANRQPAAANYVRRRGDSEYRALALDVLRIENGKVVEITAFVPDLFPAFGLPPTL
ncbi:MAG: sigma-70 family RNA polymerase sigma factor [Gaiellaceae bacterium]